MARLGSVLITTSLTSLTKRKGRNFRPFVWRVYPPSGGIFGGLPERVLDLLVRDAMSFDVNPRSSGDIT